jgi:cytochrome c-type biogenesis protein CcmH/NrfG
VRLAPSGAAVRFASCRPWPLVSIISIIGMVGMVTLPSVARAQKSPTAQAALAHAYEDLAANKLADAAAQMEIAVRFEPRFALGWYLLGSISRRAGDPDRAAAGYRRYIELRPAEPDAYFGLGLCLDAVGDHAAALAALKHYVDTEQRASSAPFVMEARTRIANLEHSGGEKVAAGAADRNAQAAALLAARKFVDAAELLRASIKIAPADAAAWYRLGFALRQAGQPSEAARAYRRSITLQPADVDAYYGLGQVLAAANQPDEALAAFRTYVKAGPEKTDARWIAKARKEIARLQDATRAPSHPGVVPATSAPRAPRSDTPGASLAAAPPARPSERAPAGRSAAPPQRSATVETRE